MTRQELVAAIKQHENNCAWPPEASFTISKVVELADGVLAARDNEGEMTIYYDKGKCRLRAWSPFEDDGSKIKNFPADIGFITNVMARGGWEAMLKTAQLSLRGGARQNQVACKPGPGRILGGPGQATITHKVV